MTFPRIILPDLPPNTIVPDDEAGFIPYLTRQIEDIAFSVNAKDFNYFRIPITDTPSDIPNIPNFGAYIVCISGEDAERDADKIPIGWLPTITVSLCKADSTAAGSVTGIGTQVGTGTWAGNALVVTSTATNFQVAHDRAGVIGNFNIRIIGTQ